MQTYSAYKVEEKRGFLRNRRGRNLFYALHMPLTELVENAWIFCNPFFEEKVFSHGIYVQFARFLAARGHLVIRFDYEGDGDSEGEYDLIDLTQWCDDTLDIVEFMRQCYPQVVINLFGLRLGACPAAFAAGRTAVQSLLLWEPVFDGEKYMEDYQKINLTSHLFTSKKEVKDRESLIRNLKTKYTINIAGYEISDKLFQQIRGHKLNNIIASLKAITQVAVIAINRPAMQAKRPEALGLASTPDLFAIINNQPFWFGSRFINMQPEELFECSLALIQRMAVPLSGNITANAQL